VEEVVTVQQTQQHREQPVSSPTTTYCVVTAAMTAYNGQPVARGELIEMASDDLTQQARDEQLVRVGYVQKREGGPVFEHECGRRFASEQWRDRHARECAQKSDAIELPAPHPRRVRTARRRSSGRRR
jgi:hypothetical protein